MPTIFATRRDGSTVEIPAMPGRSLMEALRDGGADEILALCGGNCACGTCHIYVLEGGEAASPMGADEADLLDSLDREANSRLSCQIRVSAALDGMKVQVARED